MDKVPFTGTIISVKARIRLLRSFDQIPTHQYQGYTLLLNGEIDGDHREQIKIGIGPKAQDEHQFRIGDQICGLAVPVADQKTEWAESPRLSKFIALKAIFDYSAKLAKRNASAVHLV